MSVYLATATRKRPKTFESLVGQSFVATTLQESIKKGTIAQTYLFSGPRGVGKTTSARALARALNCATGPTATPCGICPSCVGMDSGTSLDIIEIDGASHTSISDVREIKEEIRFNPTSGRYRIYIIDEVHMLSNSAFNGLLKTLEEPPAYVIFILATTELHKIPATVKSRCQQFHFNLIPFDQIVTLLKEATKEMGLEAEEEALIWIAKESTGSLRDAYTLFDQVVAFSERTIKLSEIQEKLGLLTTERLKDFVLLLAKGERNQVFRSFNHFLGEGVALEQIHHDITEYLRGLLLFQNGITATEILGSPSANFDGEIKEIWKTSALEKALSWSFETYRRLRYSLNPRFEIELMLSQLCELIHHLTPSEIWSEINRLETSLASAPLDQNLIAEEMSKPSLPPSPLPQVIELEETELMVETPEMQMVEQTPPVEEPQKDAPNAEDVSAFLSHYMRELGSTEEGIGFAIDQATQTVKVFLTSQYEENLWQQKQEILSENWQKDWADWTLSSERVAKDPKEALITEVENFFSAEFKGEENGSH